MQALPIFNSVPHVTVNVHCVGDDFFSSMTSRRETLDRSDALSRAAKPYRPALVVALALRVMVQKISVVSAWLKASLVEGKGTSLIPDWWTVLLFFFLGIGGERREFAGTEHCSRLVDAGPV